jgi:CRISPR type I-E-associated protein CasB/Cse2
MLNIEEFLSFLENHKKDRGIMADLKRGLSETTECRAWPHILRFCEPRNEKERRIVQLIAAGFAIHLRSGNSGNMGDAIRKIAGGGGKGEKGLETFDGRFRRIISASTSDELCDLLPGIMRAVERKGIPIDFAQLYKDLHFWGERSKLDWASSYWRTEKQEEGGVGDDETSDTDNG